MDLTIISYNLHSGRNTFFRKSFQQMLHYFQYSPADIFVFQEVQNNSRHGWHYKALKEHLNLNSIYGTTLSLADGSYGNAIFTRLPILQSRNITLPSLKEQRAALYSILDLNGLPLHLFNTHLGLNKKERVAQMDTLNQTMIQLNQPILLAGDMNSVHPPSFFNLQDLGKMAGKERKSTVVPLRRRIDYIFASDIFRLLDYEVLNVPYSDHYPIKAVLQIKKATVKYNPLGR